MWQLNASKRKRKEGKRKHEHGIIITTTIQKDDQCRRTLSYGNQSINKNTNSSQTLTQS